MGRAGEIDRRIAELNGDLDTMIGHYQRLARLNYLTALALRFAIVISSIVAGIGGLALDQPKLFAIVAFLPAALATFTTSLKFQDRANWHYRKKDALNGLRNSLKFELPNPPTQESVAAIARALTRLNKTMSDEWESLFGLDTQVVTRTQAASGH